MHQSFAQYTIPQVSARKITNSTESHEKKFCDNGTQSGRKLHDAA